MTPLADDGVIGGEAVVDGRTSADATLFLTREGGDDEFAGPDRRVPERDHRRRQTPFHVCGAAAEQPTVAPLDHVAVVVDLAVGRRHHIVVADKGEAGPAGNGLTARDHVPGVVARHRRVGFLAKPRFDGVARVAFVLVARNRGEAARQVHGVAHGPAEGCRRLILPAVSRSRYSPPQDGEYFETVTADSSRLSVAPPVDRRLNTLIRLAPRNPA